ncbi:MAG: sodium:proton antiporter [Polyangiaceae bacterium]
MTTFDVIALLVALAALFSFVNAKWLRLPATIGLMLVALGFSLALFALDRFGAGLTPRVEALLARVDFGDTLLQGMLCFLLFAGALHLDLGDLRENKGIISILASLGVVGSTLSVGFGSWFAFRWLGLDLGLLTCLLFGALISPTDPIAVLAILKTAKVPRALSTQIAGESLFNDGVAVVVFVALMRLASGTEGVGATDVGLLFLREVTGGTGLGLALGWVAYQLIRRIDDYQVEILLTLALVVGLYALARRLHVSGPIAVVVAGLWIGNHGRSFGMSDKTRENIDKFWELIDELLNAILFVLIGLEVIVIRMDRLLVLASGVAALLVLAARLASVGLPLVLLRKRWNIARGSVRLLTWGGLRGGISIALALSLREGQHRDTILAITYGVVVSSILLQGLTMRLLARRLLEPHGAP